MLKKTLHPTNAMAALMHHGRAPYARTAMISSDNVASWFTAASAKGKLAQETCSFLESVGAGFFAPDNTQFKTEVFLAVKAVCWAVTTRLKASLSSDLAGSSYAVKQGWERMQSLFGTERLSETGPKDLEGMETVCWAALLKFRAPPTPWTQCASTVCRVYTRNQSCRVLSMHTSKPLPGRPARHMLRATPVCRLCHLMCLKLKFALLLCAGCLKARAGAPSALDDHRL